MGMGYFIGSLVIWYLLVGYSNMRFTIFAAHTIDEEATAKALVLSFVFWPFIFLLGLFLDIYDRWQLRHHRRSSLMTTEALGKGFRDEG